MKILITGGAGYIGSHVLNLLMKNGYEIVIIDDLSTGREKSVLGGKLFKLNLANIIEVEKIFQTYEFSACLHFAGSIIVPESVEKPLDYYKNNTENSLSLISLCVRYNVNNFIFSSTAAIYGEAKGGLCSEETVIGPINPYGRSKLMTEMMLEDTASATELNYIALRYFNVAGANIDLKIGQCSPNSTHLIKIASECASGKRDKMSVFGTDYETEDGTCIRDYIHIDDLAQAHLDALEYLQANNKSHVLNCGYGRGYSVREVIDAVKRVTGKDFKVEMTGRRAGDSPVLIAKSDKIREVLNWSPKYNDLDLIVKTAFEWEKNL